MKIKYYADVLMVVLKEEVPAYALSESGGAIVRYDDDSSHANSFSLKKAMNTMQT